MDRMEDFSDVDGRARLDGNTHKERRREERGLRGSTGMVFGFLLR
jgi:hypothetical protein